MFWGAASAKWDQLYIPVVVTVHGALLWRGTGHTLGTGVSTHSAEQSLGCGHGALERVQAPALP